MRLNCVRMAGALLEKKVGVLCKSAPTRTPPLVSRTLFSPRITSTHNSTRQVVLRTVWIRSSPALCFARLRLISGSLTCMARRCPSRAPIPSFLGRSRSRTQVHPRGKAWRHHSNASRPCWRQIDQASGSRIQKSGKPLSPIFNHHWAAKYTSSIPPRYFSQKVCRCKQNPNPRSASMRRTMSEADEQFSRGCI